MKPIIDLFLVAIIVIYVVDISGFTQTLLRFFSVYKQKKISEIKPFTCSLCMTWWSGLLYLVLTANVTLPFVAYVALLSMLSVPIGQLLILVRETLTMLISKLLSLCN